MQRSFTSEKYPMKYWVTHKLSVFKTLLTLTVITLSFGNKVNGQNTCATAVSFTATNAANCTPGTSFNCNVVGTGPSFATCATGIAAPLNVWGSFTAYSATASISYTPPGNRDAMIFAYSGSCPTPTQVNCVDHGGNGNTVTVNLSGLTAGTVYYFRIVAYNRNSGSMSGNVCVASPYSIVTGSISGSPLCAGSSISIPFTSYGTYSSNTYTAQLSDASGSFASPVSIGTLTSNANSGTVSATIPSGTTTGTGYRIRVISSSPSVTGADNGANITVNAIPTITGTLGACTSGSTQLSGSGTPAAVSPWTSSLTAVATINSSGLVTAVSAGTTTITYTDINGCNNTASVVISSTSPTATGASTCVGSSGTISSSAFCSGGSSTSTGAINAGTGVNNAAVGTGAWTNPGNITATGSPYATQTLAGNTTSNYLQASNYGFSIPSNATINGITVTIRKEVISTNNMFDNIVKLVKNGTITGSNLASASAWSNGSFGISTYGSSSNLWGTTWTAADINSSNFGVVISASSSTASNRQIDIDYIQVNVSYTTSGSVNWYTASTGGTFLGTGTPFNPVGVAGSGLPNTNTAGTTTFYVECAAAPGCRGSANFVINPLPTITNSSTATDVCYSSGSQNSSLSYSATSNSPTTYSITWNAAALAAGLANVSNAAITASPLNIPVAASVAAGTYTGTLTVTNANGCTSSGNSFTITITALPTITASATAVSKCYSSSYQNCALSYSATTGSPITFSITWDAAAQAAGLPNVSNATISGSPLSFPMPAGTAVGTYNGTLTVTSANGCTSSSYSFTQAIVALPTITSAATAQSICFNSSAQNSSLAYTATSGSPTLYSIIWDATAQAAGLTNLSNAAFTGSPLTVPVAAGVVAGTYNGTIKVTNGFGCQSSSANAFTLSITSAVGPVMTSSSTSTVCTGGTLNFALTADIPATFTWIAASNSNVTGESTTLQTTSTINNTLTLSVAGSQNVIYTVTPTSTGGCVGNPQTVTVTVSPLPTITASATAASRCYSTSAQTSTLSYSATTNSPVTYYITWNAAALAAGLVNTGNTTLPASPITFSIPAGVATGTYTGSLYVTTANGCVSSTGSSFTVSITSPPSITSQPSSVAACAGTAASFSVSATGSGLTYQWRKGTTNLCNCSGMSGATTATLSISSAVAGDAATNYNCVVSSSGCSNTISNYATLTVNAANTAPAIPPKELVFPTVSTTSILASFIPTTDSAYFLVIRKTTNVAPTNPTNGTTYTLNSTALTGTIDYIGTSPTFTSNGLTPGTTYYYWIFPYNTGSCGTSPLYLTSNVLTGDATTATNVACGTVSTLYWGGTGSSLSGHPTGTDFNTAANWSTSNSTYVASPAAPSQCNDVSIALTSSATITLSGTTDIYGLTFTVSGSGRTAKLSTEGNTLSVNSNAVVDVLSGDATTTIYIGENSGNSGIVDFKANFRLGETYFSGSIPKSYIVGNINSKIIFRGDVLFGRTARFNLPGSSSYPPSYPLTTPGTGTTPGTILFDGMGLQQVLWNNNVWYDCFYNIVVGEQYKPYVKHVTGTYTPDNILNDFTINDGCTVDLGTSQWIREQNGGTFTMNGSAKLILGNNKSVKSSANTGGTVTGSNFPGGFSTMNISSNSVIEYNGGNSITQTVYATPAYGDLTLSNSDGTGTASKISTGTVTVSGTATVSTKTTFTPGTGVVIDGTANINSGATWVCGTNNVTGAGTFNLLSGGTLTIGSTAGITSSGATGNIQTSSRSFSTGGNYTYNGSSAQSTGSGLPNTMNNLTIANSSGVTMYAASRNYTVAGTLALSSNVLTINGDSLTITALTRTSGTLTGSATSSVGISGTSVPLFFTSGSRTLKNLFLNTNASADLQTTLDIVAGSSAGSVAVGSGATLNTYGYLTLKSDANGTARVSEIPVDGSGNALGTISGNVVIERYIPGKRSWRLVSAPVQSTGSQTINEAWQEGVTNTDLTNNQNPNPGYGVHISGSSATLGFDVTPLNNPSLKVFTRSTSSWGGVANTLSTHVRDYEGYMLFARGNRSTNLSQNNLATLSNTVIRETDGIRMGRQSVSLPGGTGSYSVVGNPYPSTIDFRTLSITGSGSTNTFVLWDPALTGIAGVGAYQYFTQSGGTGSNYTVFPGGGSYGVAGTVNNYVQSGQAFLVQNSGAATLTINESSKVSSSTSLVFRPAPDHVTGKISTILYGFDTDSSLTVLDGGLVMYRSEFEDSLDLNDVKKLSNLSSENFGINKNAIIYQIEKRGTINETDTIEYSMRNLKARPYKLGIDLSSMEATGMTAYLKDNYTGTVRTLDYSNTNWVDFTPTAAAAGSYAPNRFKIYFRQMNVLPVTFTLLDAYRKESTINIEWKVQNETNIKHYEVERSTDGSNFSKLGINVPANSSNAYQGTDEHPQYGMNYFRVKAVEKNGTSKYTNIAKVFFGKNSSGITVFPNPVTDGQVNLYFTAQQAGDYTARLFNNAGQLIKTVKLNQLSGNGNATIEMSRELPHGNYILEIAKPDNSKEHINIVY